jgi:serine/threonine protein kinase
MKEWTLLKELRHPNIIRVYEILETPSAIYLVMEYVENGELFSHIRACGR